MTGFLAAYITAFLVCLFAHAMTIGRPGRQDMIDYSIMSLGWATVWLIVAFFLEVMV